VIDSQHKELFKRMNDLLSAVIQGRGRNEISGFIGFLTEYTDFHFREEERYMTRFEYPAMNAHKALHDGFRADVAVAARDALSEGVTSAVVVTVVEGLGAWVRDHIKKMDVELGKFLKDKI
jgi:hemerythrin-like metal-binding protein